MKKFVRPDPILQVKSKVRVRPLKMCDQTRPGANVVNENRPELGPCRFLICRIIKDMKRLHGKHGDKPTNQPLFFYLCITLFQANMDNQIFLLVLCHIIKGFFLVLLGFFFLFFCFCLLDYDFFGKNIPDYKHKYFFLKLRSSLFV